MKTKIILAGGTGTFFLRTQTELVLKSRRVVPTRALQPSYLFDHSHISNALDALFGQRAQHPRT